MISAMAEPELTILLCGKTGVGKSTLINSILRAELARVGGPGHRSEPEPSSSTLKPVTSGIEPITGSVRGVNVMLFDSPGLQDGTGRDDEHLHMLTKPVESSDLILYCSEMTASRWLPADINAIKELMKRFGKGFWSKCILVLTKANQFQLSKRIKSPEHKKEWCEHCKKAFLDLEKTFKDTVCDVNPEIEVKHIPVIAAGLNEKDPEDHELYFVSPDLYDSDYLGELWLQCLKRLPPSNTTRLALLKTTNFNTMMSSEADSSSVQQVEDKLKECITTIQHTDPKRDTTATDPKLDEVPLSEAKATASNGKEMGNSSHPTSLSSKICHEPVPDDQQHTDHHRSHKAPKDTSNYKSQHDTSTDPNPEPQPKPKSKPSSYDYPKVEETDDYIRLNKTQTEKALKAKEEPLELFLGTVLGYAAIGARVGSEVETALVVGSLGFAPVAAAPVMKLAIKGLLGVSIGGTIGGGVGLTIVLFKYLFS